MSGVSLIEMQMFFLSYYSVDLMALLNFQFVILSWTPTCT